MAASRRKRRRSGGYTAPGRRGQGPGVRPEQPPASRRAPRERPPAPRGAVLIACGIALASLAGLELSVREHLAGFKSHSTVLAGALAVLALAAGYFLLPSSLLAVNLLIGAIVFGIAFYAFRELFKRRSGGLGFR